MYKISIMKYLELLFLLYLFHSSTSVRPAYEDDPERCQFTNRDTINGKSAEMTPKTPGKKYFRRLTETREQLIQDKAVSVCRMYNLEAAEIVDQDDYDEAMAIVKETGWTFWIATKGKYMEDYGAFHIDYKLADGQTKVGFYDFGPVPYQEDTITAFKAVQEGCAVIKTKQEQPSGVCWAKVGCFTENDILCQYTKPCYNRSELWKDPTRPVKRLQPMIQKHEEESGYEISIAQATWPFAKQVCEDAGMSLVWFDDDVERDAFVGQMDAFIAYKAHYTGKPFWTAGRFSPSPNDTNIYAKLYWLKYNTAFEAKGWNLETALTGAPESSGGFTKSWGIDQEIILENKNEPYDDGGSKRERCVDATFEKNGHFFTSKCDEHLRYFVCKNADIVKEALSRPGTSKPSFMEFCNGDEYHQYRIKECNGEVIFASQTKPDCTCFSGV